VDAITASTITSRAFLRAIQNAYDKIIAGQDVTSGASQQASAASMGTPEVID
jgi:electron transport complex protein RnfG